MRPIPAIVALAVMSLALPAGAAQNACSSGHLRVRLHQFDSSPSSHPFYLAVEPPSGPTQSRFHMLLTGDPCFDNFSVTYDAAPAGGSYGATSNDFDPKHGTWSESIPAGEDEPKTRPVDVTLKANTGDQAVETIAVRLSNPQAAGFATPWDAPMLIVDANGATRVAFDGHPSAASESTGTIDVPVFRAGPVGTDTTVSYTIEPDGPTPADSSDWTDQSGGTVTFTGNQRLAYVRVGLNRDPVNEGPEGLKVTLTGATGADVAGPSEAAVTILDADTVLPSSRFHHPRQGLRYKRGDYRLREMHVFTEDRGGTSVVGAELALMQKMKKKGRCKWWNGKRFRRGSCDQQRWISLPQYEADFFYYRIPALRASMGKTKVRKYSAYARAMDSAGNTEVALDKGRNANTFEVKKKRKRRR